MKVFLSVFFCVCTFFLCADDNFKWTLKDGGINLKIAGNCYLYAGNLKINALDCNGKKLNVMRPDTVKYNDEFFGKTDIYPAGDFVFKAENGTVAGADIFYQGCRMPSVESGGICFMPQKITLGKINESLKQNIEKVFSYDNFEFVRRHEGTMSADEMIAFLNKSEKTEIILNNEKWWDGKSVWLILFILLGGGFLLNFTPCVLPMIPVNLAIISSGDSKSTAAGLLRGIYYAVGMTCAYGLLGVVVVLSGARFGELNSSVWFNLIIAFIFFALALAMGGVWRLDFSAKLNSVNPMKWKIGRPLAIFLMGATAALMGGACVAPAVIGMLLLAATVYESMPVVGLAVPFVFGCGMGILWIAAGATMGKILPKPGKWMVYVKNILAVFIALLGVYYLWIAFSLSPGKFDPDKEIAVLQQAMIEASERKQPVFIDFWASWCKNCAYMEKYVLGKPQVKAELQKYKVVKFQAENLSDPAIAEVLKKYNIQGLPAFVILEEKK